MTIQFKLYGNAKKQVEHTYRRRYWKKRKDGVKQRYWKTVHRKQKVGKAFYYEKKHKVKNNEAMKQKIIEEYNKYGWINKKVDYEEKKEEQQKTWVKPYTRKSGVKVKGYWRRKPK